MKKAKLKIGDKVKIVPHDIHENYIIKHYGKVLTVVNVVETRDDDPYLYKIKGIKNYATGQDLIKVK